MLYTFLVSQFYKLNVSLLHVITKVDVFLRVSSRNGNVDLA